MRTVCRFLAVSAVVLVASCGTQPAERCVPGVSAACTCTDGRSGAQVCQGDGTFAECVCQSPTDAGSGGGAGNDAGLDAGSDAGLDAGGGDDAGTDAGLDAGLDGGADGGTDAGLDGGTDGGTDGGCIPSTEVCDGIDNDCNGSVDDGLGTTTCGTGTCQRTVTNCVGGVPNTCTPGGPSSEVCDGVDNNCNGTVDEGDPGGGGACTTGLLGVCGVGTRHCVNGSLMCAQNVMSSSEVCDGVDNNCNGTVDEGDPGGGGACTTGLLGVCGLGTRHCVNGSLTCAQNVMSSSEVCDGLDNDCNGTVDEGDPGGGATCSTGLPGGCATGTVHCVLGALTCVKPGGC